MKRIISAVFIIAATINSFAQSFKGGVMAGLVTSQVDGDTYSGYNRAGLNAGGYAGIDLSEKFALRMEMKFVQKGAYKRSNPDAGDFENYSLRLNYAEIPVMLKYKYKPKISFDAGAGFGYMAGSEWKDDYGVVEGGVPFSKFEISYNIGGYYNLTDRIAFNVRYSYSVLPVRKGIYGQRYILFSWGQFNNVLSFSFYYQFKKPDE